MFVTRSNWTGKNLFRILKLIFPSISFITHFGEKSSSSFWKERWKKNSVWFCGYHVWWKKRNFFIFPMWYRVAAAMPSQEVHISVCIERVLSGRLLQMWQISIEIRISVLRKNHSSSVNEPNRTKVDPIRAY